MTALPISKRFRGFLPVVIDVETGGFDANKDALLELAAVFIVMDENGVLHPSESIHHHIKPFAGANMDPEALEFNGIEPEHPFRFAVDESEALADLFAEIKSRLGATKCSRGVLVGHNSWFDLTFLNAATHRSHLESPLHAFTSFDTATLSALAFGQTVLARSAKAAKIPFDVNEAHSAIYDAERTAELFCHIINNSKLLV